MVAPLIAVSILAVYYLWSVIFAAENAHIRSREGVLHGSAYQDADGATGSAPFSGNNYKKASSRSFRFESESEDQSLDVFGESDTIKAKAVITSE